MILYVTLTLVALTVPAPKLYFYLETRLYIVVFLFLIRA